MRRPAAAIILACALFGLSACGGGDGDRGPQTFIAQILSDSSYDGDIQQTGPGTYVVTQGMSSTVQSIFAGIDPGGGTEYRAFLDFPLTGQDGVPGDALIQSAFLDLYIDDLQPTTATLPVLIELVSFDPPTLIETDFDRTQQPPLASITISPPIGRSDVGNIASIDVTPLMQEAQRRGLANFQIRIMEDLVPAVSALMEIDDTTGPDRQARAPLLTVTYY